MKTSLLLSLAVVILPQTLACTVVLDGEDLTDEFFVVDPITNEPYVECLGHYSCKDAVITDCPTIKCVENEACYDAQIINFTKSVLCEGAHACHRTEMTAAVSDSSSDSHQTVSCQGAGACDVAQITGPLKQVSCSGVKSCRKANIKDSKLVKCHDGKGKSFACEGLATLQTDCLYCGRSGCAGYINMCRYKIIGENDKETDKYIKCKPETIVGNCPAELEAELRLELNGKEEVEGGLRKSRRL